MNEVGSLNVSLGMNAQDFKNGINTANRQLKMLQTEFKATESGLGELADGFEGYQAKSRYLTASIDVQKNKLEILQEEHRKVAESQGEDSAAAQNLQIRINEATRTLNDMQNELRTTDQALEVMSQGVEGLEREINTLNSGISDHENKLDALNTQLRNTITDYGETSEEAKRLKEEIEKTTKELNDMQDELKQTNQSLEAMQNSTEEAEQSLSNMSDETQNAGDQGEETEGKMSLLAGGLKGGLVTAAIAATTAIIALTVKMSAMSDEFKRASNQLRASTGATKEEIAGLEKQLLSVYKNNFGESFDDVARSMSTVRMNSKRLAIDSKEDIGRITEQALLLRDTFEFEVNESTRAAGSLIKAFGINANYAFDLIAKGAQNGLNMSDDLIDTVNEYSPQFKAAGFSAEEMFQILQNGAENGAFTVDKAADAIKEFNIRSKDASKGSMEAFASLGLNADKMVKQFAQGGTSARDAFAKVSDALNKIQDPVKLNTVGVALFGTQFEDLEATGLKALINLKDKAFEANGTISDINAIKYDSFSEMIAGLIRKIDGEMLPVWNNFTASLRDTIDTVSAESSGWMDSIGKSFSDMGQGIADMWASFTQTDFAQWFVDAGNSIMGFLEPVGGMFMDMIDSIDFEPLLDALSRLWTALKGVWDILEPFVIPVLEATISVISDFAKIVGVVLVGAFGLLMSAFDAIVAALTPFTTMLVEAVNLVLNTFIMIVEGLFGETEKSKKAFVEMGKSIINIFKALWDTIVALFYTFGSNLDTFFNNLLKKLTGSTFPEMLNAIGKWISDAWNSLSKGFNNIVDSASKWGGNLIKEFVKGIKDKIKWVTDAVSNVAETVKDYLGFHSPTKKGPGSEADKWAPNFIGMFAKGLLAGKTVIANSAITLMDAFKGVLKVEIDNISKMFDKISENVKARYAEMKSAVYGDLNNIADVTMSALKKKYADELESFKINKQREIDERKAMIESEAELINKKWDRIDNIEKGADDDRKAMLKATREKEINQYKTLQEEGIKNAEIAMENEKTKYDMMLTEQALYQETANLMQKGNQQALIALLAEFEPGWQDKGKSFAEKFIEGFVGQKETMATAINNVMNSLVSLKTTDVSAINKTLDLSEIDFKSKINKMTQNALSWSNLDKKNKLEIEKEDKLYKARLEKAESDHKIKLEKSDKTNKDLIEKNHKNNLLKLEKEHKNNLSKIVKLDDAPKLKLEKENELLGNNLGLSKKSGKWYLPTGDEAFNILDNANATNNTTVNNTVKTSNTNNTQSIMVQVPVTLDGKIITNSVSNIQMSNNQSKLRSLGVK